jgi:hypothetical protein
VYHSFSHFWLSPPGPPAIIRSETRSTYSAVNTAIIHPDTDQPISNGLRPVPNGDTRARLTWHAFSIKYREIDNIVGSINSMRCVKKHFYFGKLKKPKTALKKFKNVIKIYFYFQIWIFFKAVLCFFILRKRSAFLTQRIEFNGSDYSRKSLFSKN